MLPPVITITLRRIGTATRIRSGDQPAKGAREAQVGKGSVVNGGIEIRAEGGRVLIANDSLVEGTLVTETPSALIEVGDNVFVGGGTIVAAVQRISIENNVLISYQCLIVDSDNHSLDANERIRDLAAWRGGKYNWAGAAVASVRICEGAWVGARSIILKGVTIGRSSVVGAGSVVTADVPDGAVVAGNPARVVKMLRPDQVLSTRAGAVDAN